MNEKLVNEGIAKVKLNFKMRDWVFSRQRYWGEPIPMIKCPDCGWVPVPENELPVTLPIVDSYEPTKDGESPLSLITSWVNCKCPVCGKDAKRETDTMPGWAGSSWYYMRYCDPKNDKEFASMDALKAWLPVGLYNGGNEHTTRHLLYARFWNKFLYDIGLSPVNEPFMSRVSQGIVLGSNGTKMSKSLGNVIDPRDVINDYGADSLRVWEAFMGDYFEMVNWNNDGAKSCNRFLQRVWNIQDMLTTIDVSELDYSINYAIKKVSQDIDGIKFNTAISTLMSTVNDIYKVNKISENQYKTLLILLNPFAPHMTEEIWTNLGFEPKIYMAKWPECDESKLVKNQIEIVVQVNSKIADRIMVRPDITEDEAKTICLSSKKVTDKIDGKNIVKFIYVKGKLANFIVK